MTVFLLSADHHAHPSPTDAVTHRSAQQTEETNSLIISMFLSYTVSMFLSITISTLLLNTVSMLQWMKDVGTRTCLCCC